MTATLASQRDEVVVRWVSKALAQLLEITHTAKPQRQPEPDLELCDTLVPELSLDTCDTLVPSQPASGEQP